MRLVTAMRCYPENVPNYWAHPWSSSCIAGRWRPGRWPYRGVRARRQLWQLQTRTDNQAHGDKRQGNQFADGEGFT